MKKSLISILVAGCLSSNPACAEVMALQVVADGLEPIDALVESKSGHYFVAPDDLLMMGIDTSKLESMDGRFDVSQIGQVTLDELTSTLKVQTRPDLLPRTQIDMRGTDMFMSPAKPQGTFLNYDLRAETGLNRSVGGLLEANTFADEVRMNLLTFMQSGQALQRLSASISKEDASTATTWSIGDGYSLGGAGVAPVRFIGAQYRKDYSLTPGFIASPSLNLSGTAAAPSSVDVMVGNQIVKSQQVPAGPFDITNIQPALGSGGAYAIVTDPFGQQQAIGVNVTGNPSLLAEDVEDFAVQGGVIRPTLMSTESPFVSGFYKRGITNSVTGEANVEASQAGSTLPAVRHSGVSLTAATPLGNFNLGGRVGTGSSATFGYNNAWHNQFEPTVSASVTKSSTDYLQLGGGQISPLAASVSGSIHKGRLTISTMHTVTLGQRFTSTSFVYSPSRVDDITWSANLNHLSGSTNSSSIMLNASIPLDSHYSVPKRSHVASTSVGSTGQSIDYQNRTKEPVGAAIRARLERSSIQKREEGYFDYRAYSFDAGFAFSAVQQPISNQSAGRVYMKGALVLDESNDVLPSRFIENGYAVVDAGIQNAQVLVNGSTSARTNKSGKAVATGFPPFIRTAISIDGEDLPDNYDSVSVDVSTYRKAGTSVVFIGRTMSMVKFPWIKSGRLTVDGQDYPITDRGAYVELPPGEYTGTANGKNVRFEVKESSELQTVLASIAAVKLGLYK